MENKYFLLKEDVVLIEGAKCGTILDLVNRKIYSIDCNAKLYISMLEKGESLEKVLYLLPDNDRLSFNMYLDKLVEKGLAYYSDIYYKPVRYIPEMEKFIDTAWFELRKSCNLKCCHCYLDCDGGKDSNLELLSLEQWKDVVNELKNQRINRIILIGGEPLLCKDIEALMDYIRFCFKNITIVLYSNLTILRDEVLDCIIRNNIKVVTSVYSYDEKIHDKITGHTGSWQKTVQGIEMIKKSGGTVRANTVLMNLNESDIEKTKEFIKEKTGKELKIDIVRDVGKSKKYLLPKTAVPIKNENHKFIGINKEQFIRNMSGNSCWQGKINITCDGYVSPCIMGENFIDKNYNVKNQSIEEILEGFLKPDLWSISRDKIKVCSDCEFRYVCKDCRPLCGTKENILDREPKCTYNPY